MIYCPDLENLIAPQNPVLSEHTENCISSEHHNLRAILTRAVKMFMPFDLIISLMGIYSKGIIQENK